MFYEKSNAFLNLNHNQDKTGYEIKQRVIRTLNEKENYQS